MTPLYDQFVTQIKENGPIPISLFMQNCLLHPEYGYYNQGDIFGKAGDFITAPEISQMFGELIGLCLAQYWLDIGAPEHFCLVELGPGRGTLMKDILRATQNVPNFNKAASVYLLEASHNMRKIQESTLLHEKIHWIDKIEDLPKLPILLVANEFFDALPIRQFERRNNNWFERQVGLKNNNLSLGLSHGPVTHPILTERLNDTKCGDVVEINTVAKPIINALGHHIEQNSGTALIIDYGDWHSQGDTLQAVKAHKTVGIFDNVGQADLTAHVDFEYLALNCGCAFSRLTSQGVFLERLGITKRAQNLMDKSTANNKHFIINAHRRLTHPNEMGNLFKVMALFQKTKEPPAGLTT